MYETRVEDVPRPQYGALLSFFHALITKIACAYFSQGFKKCVWAFVCVCACACACECECVCVCACARERRWLWGNQRMRVGVKYLYTPRYLRLLGMGGLPSILRNGERCVRVCGKRGVAVREGVEVGDKWGCGEGLWVAET